MLDWWTEESGFDSQQTLSRPVPGPTSLLIHLLPAALSPDHEAD
jgi:hypothetical protein